MNLGLVDRLRQDFPDFRFLKGPKFAFRPPFTIVMGAEEPFDLLLLHEVGHAVLRHKTFDTGAERVKMERAAWEKARGLSRKYGVFYDETVVERELDSYRDWLDKKSRCPKCGLTRFQTPDGVFHCPRCDI